MTNPTFTVIVPCYNEEKSIRKCVESLLKQTYADFEIVVINDGSKDNTTSEIRRFKDARIRLVDNKKNKGRRAAINDGLAKAKGQYVAITDADCVIPKNWLSRINNQFEKDPKLDAVGGVYEPIGTDAMSLAGNLLERIFMDFGIIPNLLPGANSAYKTKVLRKAGGYPERLWGADSFLTMLLKEKGHKIKITSSIVVKTTYPNTLKKALRRKFYWGGGLASILDKMKFRPGFLIRPLYFTLLIVSVLFTLVSLFIGGSAVIAGGILTTTLLVLPNLAIFGMSLLWIMINSESKYLKALPLMLFLPFLQEFSYFIGFVYVLFGRGLKNAWR